MFAVIKEIFVFLIFPCLPHGNPNFCIVDNNFLPTLGNEYHPTGTIIDIIWTSKFSLMYHFDEKLKKTMIRGTKPLIQTRRFAFYRDILKNIKNGLPQFDLIHNIDKYILNQKKNFPKEVFLLNWIVIRVLVLKNCVIV